MLQNKSSKCIFLIILGQMQLAEIDICTCLILKNRDKNVTSWLIAKVNYYDTQNQLIWAVRSV